MGICQLQRVWGKLGFDLYWSFTVLWVSQQGTANSSKLWTAQQDLMIPGERWQLVRRWLQPGQLWTPWDSLDESILHFYSQEKGEDNCSVLMAASNCFERWRTVIKPQVTNHLDSDKSLEWDSEHVVFLLFILCQPLNSAIFAVHTVCLLTYSSYKLYNCTCTSLCFNSWSFYVLNT